MSEWWWSTVGLYQIKAQHVILIFWIVIWTLLPFNYYYSQTSKQTNTNVNRQISKQINKQWISKHENKKKIRQTNKHNKNRGHIVLCCLSRETLIAIYHSNKQTNKQTSYQKKTQTKNLKQTLFVVSSSICHISWPSTTQSRALHIFQVGTWSQNNLVSPIMWQTDMLGFFLPSRGHSPPVCLPSSVLCHFLLT